MSTVWADVREALQDSAAMDAISAPEGAWAPILAEIAGEAPLLVVTATGRQAEELADRIGVWGDLSVAYFPAWETLPHERLSPSADIVGARLAILRRRSFTIVAPCSQAMKSEFAFIRSSDRD